MMANPPCIQSANGRPALQTSIRYHAATWALFAATIGRKSINGRGKRMNVSGLSAVKVVALWNRNLSNHLCHVIMSPCFDGCQKTKGDTKNGSLETLQRSENQSG